jgi:hypothetical protein
MSRIVIVILIYHRHRPSDLTSSCEFRGGRSVTGAGSFSYCFSSLQFVNPLLYNRASLSA